MTVTIHCIRHGQGLHNAGAGSYDLRDPSLTSEGKAQCLALRDEHFKSHPKASLIAASPMLRAIESAVLIFQSAPQSEHQATSILAIPDAQETSTDPCDVGSDLADLRKSCMDNGWTVDLSLVKHDWNTKKLGSRYSPSSRAIAHRAGDLRLFFREQARKFIKTDEQDVNIVLVTHGGFLHYFTGDWEGAETRPGTGWVNCETRSYAFEHGVDSDDDGDARLIETQESRHRRGLQHPMQPKDKQSALYEAAMQAWENQGLQNHGQLDVVEAAAEASGNTGESGS